MTTADEIRSMTYQQLQDWWVSQPENGGWLSNAGLGFIRSSKADNKIEYAEIDELLEDTLEAVAACLGEGWVWWKENLATRMQRYCACNRDEWGKRCRQVVNITDTGDEKTDRLRLACLARLVERGSK